MIDENDDGLLGEDLLDEIEEWDKMFDSLHLPESPASEALAQIRQMRPTPAPTSPAAREEDADPFALPDEDDLQLDGEPRALGALLGSPGRGPPPRTGEEDDGLLTSALRPGSPALPAGEREALPSGKRSAAIVRRPGAGPKRSLGGPAGEAWARPEPWKERPPDPSGETGEGWPEERTHAVAAELVERLAESAEALFRDAPPEVTLELDEAFYEGIEVAPGAGEARVTADTRPAPIAGEQVDQARAPAPAGELPTRRTTTHIVRRAATPTGRMPVAEDIEGAEVRRMRDARPTAPTTAGARGQPDQGPEVAPPRLPLRASIPPPVRHEAMELESPTREQDLPTAEALARASRPEPEAESEGTIPWGLAGEKLVQDPDLESGGTIPWGSPWVPPAEARARERHAAARDAPAWTSRRGRSPFDDDDELDAALDGAVAIDDGTLVSTAPPGLFDADVAPDLPPSPFPPIEATIDFDALAVSDVEISADDRTEELARQLVLYERELALLDEPGPAARLRLEAGRLAEQLGDLDRARTHYDTALQLDPRLRPPLRALRRVERALGNFGESIRHLDAEIELASARERRALAAHRADLLMATGEQDVARVAVGDLVDEGPTDVRALLADLELAWVDGRKDELDALLDRLAQAVADRALAGAMARARGVLAEARGGEGGPAYRGALLVDPSDRLAWMGLAHAALARGDAGESAELTGHLVGQGGLGSAAPQLAGALAWRRGEALIGRGELASAARSVSRASELLPDEADLGELHAVLLEAGGQPGQAADALARAAAAARTRGRAARLLRRAAALRAAIGERAAATSLLRDAALRDPAEPLAAIDLASALEAAGDDGALIEQRAVRVRRDLDGALLARVRLARRLERLGRAGEAVTLLAGGRAAGRPSAALDAELDRAYARAGDLAERARLCHEQAEEKPPHLDRLVVERRAAAALEAVARSGAQAPSPVPVEARRGDDLDDRGAGDFLAGFEDEMPVPDLLRRKLTAPDGVFEVIFSTATRAEGAPRPAPEAAGLPAGVWREPTAPDPLGRPAGPAGAEPPSGAAPMDPTEARALALAAWRRLLSLDPGSSVARAGALRLSAEGPCEERLAVLAEAQGGEPQAAWAIELALRRAELLVAGDGDRGDAGDGAPPAGDRSAAEEVLTAAAQLDADDPRSTVALLRLLAADRRWSEAASLLADRAEALGDGDQATGYRYRAASILLDSGDESRRALDLLTAIVQARPDFLIAAELLRAAQRRLGEAPPAADAVSPPPATSGRRERDDGFARFLREAEMVELQLGDPGRAAALYQRALELRPDDPLARDGFARNAERAGEAAPLAGLALADLRQAEAMGDGVAKATAYEELARIDAELRGDLASALLGWGAAVESDPTRMTAMRALERAFIAAGRERDPELYQLYGRVLDALDGAHDQAAMLGELARLAGRTGRPHGEVVGHYRRWRELDPVNRTALFHLEAHARTGGPSPELAELEQAVARAFAGDPRAEAAFHTRAGETLQALGDRAGAVAAFRAAVTALPESAPALTGWRDAAVSAGMWLEVAEAAERAAEAAAGDRERAALHHLAGVVLMDRALDAERAIAALRLVVDLEPGHTDGFLRLKLLYEETGQDAELIELYHQRLAVEGEPAMRVALHQGMAGLYRNFFDDREGARRHLRSALQLEPDNLRAIADLSDLAWEVGDWAEAAETLIARARLETRPEVLCPIFYRLGTIYADRLQDPRYAMMSFQKVLTYDPGDIAALEQVADLAARSGDHRLALGACEQLVKLATSDPDKVVHLHRAARVYMDGLHDQQKAERAYRIALDMDPTSDAALSALVDFYAEVGDTQSARVHLDRVAGAMRQRIADEPAEVQAYQVLSRALEARGRAGIAGSLATARCAAEIAVRLGSRDPRDAELAAGSGRARPPLAGLAATEVDDLLFPAPVSGSLRALFRLLGDRLAKHLGVDIRRYGVGRGERLRAGGDPLAGMILEMAAEMGIADLEVYLSPRQPTVLAVEPTSPPSLVIGAQLASLDRPAELRFLVGRALKLARSSLALPARMNADELGSLLAGILRQFAPDFTPAGLDPAQVSSEQQKLRRLIPHHMVQELAPFGIEIAGGDFDHRAVWAGIVDGGNRAGLLAAGSAAAAIDSLLRLGGHRDIQQASRDAFVSGLLRFAVSEDHAALRAQLES